jgi:hypothetical protein
MTAKGMPDTGIEIHETAISGRNNLNHMERPGSASTQAGTGLRPVCSGQQGGTGYTAYSRRYRNGIDNYDWDLFHIHTVLDGGFPEKLSINAN